MAVSPLYLFLKKSEARESDREAVCSLGHCAPTLDADFDHLTPCVCLTQSKAKPGYSAFLSIRSASAPGDET